MTIGIGPIEVSPTPGRVQLEIGGPLFDLPNYRAIGRLLIDDVPTQPVRMQLFQFPGAEGGSATAIIAKSMNRRGRPRAVRSG